MNGDSMGLGGGMPPIDPNQMSGVTPTHQQRGRTEGIKGNDLDHLFSLQKMEGVDSKGLESNIVDRVLKESQFSKGSTVQDQSKNDFKEFKEKRAGLGRLLEASGQFLGAIAERGVHAGVGIFKAPVLSIGFLADQDFAVDKTKADRPMKSIVSSNEVFRGSIKEHFNYLSETIQEMRNKGE